MLMQPVSEMPESWRKPKLQAHSFSNDHIKDPVFTDLDANRMAVPMLTVSQTIVQSVESHAHEQR